MPNSRCVLVQGLPHVYTVVSQTMPWYKHTFICIYCIHTHTQTHSVDNSEWMRNGDFIPTRLQSQQDAVNVVTRMKTRQNVENSVGLLSLAE